MEEDKNTATETALYATQFVAKMPVENSGIVALSTDPELAKQQMETYLKENYGEFDLLMFEPFVGELTEEAVTELIERSKSVFNEISKTLN